jgi:hypothetical protein
MLVALAADAVLQGLHLRRRTGLHRLPLTLRPVGGLSGLLLDRALPGSDVGLGLADPRLNLLIRFPPGLVSRTLSIPLPVLAARLPAQKWP